MQINLIKIGERYALSRVQGSCPVEFWNFTTSRWEQGDVRASIDFLAGADVAQYVMDLFTAPIEIVETKEI